MDSTAERKALQELGDEILRLCRLGKRKTRQLARFRELCFAGTWQQFKAQDYPWYMDLMHEPRLQDDMLALFEATNIKGHGYQSLDEYATFFSAMVWSLGKLFEKADTASWFIPSPGLVYKLLATDLRGATMGDLHLPLPGFYIELPYGLFKIYNRATGIHDVGAMLIAEGAVEGTAPHTKGFDLSDLGPRLFLSLLGEANANSPDARDDAVSYFSVGLANPSLGVEAALEVDTYRLRNMQGIGAKRLRERRGYIGDTELEWMDFDAVVLKFVLNLCLYMGSDGAEVRHIHDERIAKLRAKPKMSKTDKARIARLKADRIFDVGTSVKVDKHIEAHVRSGGKGIELAYRVLVRGHWRNQACGVGRKDHKTIWIHPHIRGADLPTKIVGHTYEVE